MENVLNVEKITNLRNFEQKDLFFSGNLSITNKIFEFPKVEPVKEIDSPNFSFAILPNKKLVWVEEKMIVGEEEIKGFTKERRPINNLYAIPLEEKKVLLFYDLRDEVRYIYIEKEDNYWVVKDQDSVISKEYELWKVVSPVVEAEEDAIIKIFERYSSKLL